MKHIGIILLIAVAVLVPTACTTTHTSPKQWSDITEGTSRSELVHQLGGPASRSQSVDTWIADGWRLRVTYDDGEHATNIVQELILR
jgi:hypothetical protein